VSDTGQHRKLSESDLARHAASSRHRRQYTTQTDGRKARRTSIVVGVVTAAAAVAAAVVFGLPALSTGTTADTSRTAAGSVADSLGSSIVGDTGHAVNKLPRADTAKSSQLGKSASAGSKAGRPAAQTPAKTSATKSPAKASAAKTPSKASAAKTPSKAATTRQAATAHNAATAVYLNPLRKISGLMVERIDMGADFGGSGPVYAIGDGVITNATADSPGWPGGGWITYQLTDGPAKGLMVYLAEDVTPTVQVGQHVTPNTVIANMYNGSAGIETGWAMPDGSSAESQLPAAGGISGNGPFPTAVGKNFAELLNALGVPLSPFNGSAAPYGVLPSDYPSSYSSLKA